VDVLTFAFVDVFITLTSLYHSVAGLRKDLVVRSKDFPYLVSLIQKLRKTQSLLKIAKVYDIKQFISTNVNFQ
jgi:hypothetical protein